MIFAHHRNCVVVISVLGVKNFECCFLDDVFPTHQGILQLGTSKLMCTIYRFYAYWLNA